MMVPGKFFELNPGPRMHFDGRHRTARFVAAPIDMPLVEVAVPASGRVAGIALARRLVSTCAHICPAPAQAQSKHGAPDTLIKLVSSLAKASAWLQR